MSSPRRESVPVPPSAQAGKAGPAVPGAPAVPAVLGGARGGSGVCTVGPAVMSSCPSASLEMLRGFVSAARGA